jgi:hypothetical protein
MKTTLLAILASAGLACAELSPKEFNDLRNVAVHYAGCYYSGTSRVGNAWFYRFDRPNKSNEQAPFMPDEPAAFVPMAVTNFEEAKWALIASMGTLTMCERQWKKPLDQFLRREIPLPPPGFTEIEWTQ